MVLNSPNRLSNITVAIPTKDDYENITQIVRNILPYFDDIYVIDSIEHLKTKIFCKEQGVNYIVFNWDGHYPKKRNWFLLNHQIRQFIFFMDSDERVTDKFVRELSEINLDKYDVIKVKYRNEFMGRILKHGDTMSKYPIFRSNIRFQRIDDFTQSAFDMEIHEHPVFGYHERVGILKERLIHLERISIRKYIMKHNEYSDWEANRLLSGDSAVLVRSKLKYMILNKPFGWLIYFIYSYLFRLGFLDGVQGLRIAILKAFYFYTIYLKYNEKNYR